MKARILNVLGNNSYNKLHYHLGDTVTHSGVFNTLCIT